MADRIRDRDGKLAGDWDSARKKVEASSAFLSDALAQKKASAEA